MKRSFVSAKLGGQLAAAATVLAIVAPAQAGELSCLKDDGENGCGVNITYAPFVGAGNEGENVFVPAEVGEDGKGKIENFTFTTEDGSNITLANVDFDPDPGIIFGLGVTSGAVSGVFSFAFSTPISLTGSISAASSLGITLTDGSLAGLGGAPGATVAPFGVGAKILTANDFNASLDAINKGVDVGLRSIWGAAGTPTTGDCSITAGATSVCLPESATNTFATLSTQTVMGATVSFVLTERDSVSMSGSVTQIPVPEPASYAMMLAGLAALSACTARRRGGS